MSARVAIITPTYQHRKFVAACVESVLAQTEDRWEMVVIDDGSTDGTADIISKVRDPRIHLIERRHRGLGALGNSYNSALAASRAPLIAVLEGDDAWPSDKLERQLADFDDPDIVLSYGAAALLDEEGRQYAVAGPRRRTDQLDNRPPGAIIDELAGSNFIVAPTVIVRRSSLEGIGGFQQPPGVPYVDHLTWLMLAQRGTFRYHPEIVGFWRRHAAQYTTSSVQDGPPDMSYVDRHRSYAGVGGLQPSSEVSRRSVERSALNRFRQALLAGSGRSVVNQAIALLRSGRPRLAGIALLGFVSWLGGGDLEWLARRQRIVSWPSRRHSRPPRGVRGACD